MFSPEITDSNIPVIVGEPTPKKAPEESMIVGEPTTLRAPERKVLVDRNVLFNYWKYNFYNIMCRTEYKLIEINNPPFRYPSGVNDEKEHLLDEINYLSELNSKNIYEKLVEFPDVHYLSVIYYFITENVIIPTGEIANRWMLIRREKSLFSHWKFSLLKKVKKFMLRKSSWK